jgi:iron complex transport system ATP-binding protein
MLSARDIGVRLDGRAILEDVSFEAAAGAVTAIVGPNGSGKTTLLRVLCGELGTEGTVSLNGRDLRRLKPWQAAEMRAVLPQASHLPFPFSVREVVEIGCGAGGSARSAERRAQLPEAALERVGLGGFGGRFYGELSGGEQQRVQLARVLCQVWRPLEGGEPRWLLLDEPVSSLDIRHQLGVMDIARDFAAAGGGVVAVLHDLNLAAMFAGRIVVMHAGRVAAAGPPGDVVEDDLLHRVFGAPLRVGAVPPPEIPFVLPQSAGP